VASDGTAGAYFGFPVSLDGVTIFIGATLDNDNGIHSGSVYVLIKGGGGNQPPDTPSITGPTKGKIKIPVEYNFITTDPNGDEINYFIEWGDGTDSGWIGPFFSGEEINQAHTWTKKGDYTIKAKAKDSNGAESDWGKLLVTMPCSYNLPFMHLWEGFFQRFPNAFPFLRHLLGY